MMYTFYQSEYYASHNRSFPSTSEEKHAFWVGFGENVGDAITLKHLDSSSNELIYRSAVCPADELHPNKHLLTDLGGSVASNKYKPFTVENLQFSLSLHLLFLEISYSLGSFHDFPKDCLFTCIFHSL